MGQGNCTGAGRGRAGATTLLSGCKVLLEMQQGNSTDFPVPHQAASLQAVHPGRLCPPVRKKIFRLFCLVEVGSSEFSDAADKGCGSQELLTATVAGVGMKTHRIARATRLELYRYDFHACRQFFSRLPLGNGEVSLSLPSIAASPYKSRGYGYPQSLEPGPWRPWLARSTAPIPDTILPIRTRSPSSTLWPALKPMTVASVRPLLQPGCRYRANPAIRSSGLRGFCLGRWHWVPCLRGFCGAEGRQGHREECPGLQVIGTAPTGHRAPPRARSFHATALWPASASNLCNQGIRHIGADIASLDLSTN